MNLSVEEIATQAIGLRPSDRARLVELLLASMPDEADAGVEASWDEELRRRVEAVETGGIDLIPAADVHSEARKIYRR